MLTNTERQQIVEEVNAGTYGIDEALDDIAAAQKGEEVRKALYAEALVLNREGHAGSTDMIARQQIANLQTSVNGQISTLRTEVGDDIDDLETAFNSGLATQDGRIAAQDATIANVVANYNVEYGSTELWASTGETGALAAGTTVTLSEDVSHFDYIDIYSFCGNSNVLDTVPVDAKLQSNAGYALRWVNLSDPGSGSYKAYVRIIETQLHIIGTTLTIDHQVTYRNGEEVNISGAEITQSNRSTYMGELGIMKVVGRKITANTEIEDVRVGADGTEYNSAGQAVRAQVNDLYDAIPAIDDGLNTAGAAADAAAVGSQLARVKSAFEFEANATIPVWIMDQTYNTPSSVTSKLPNDLTPTVGYACTYLACTAGDVFYITGHGGNGSKLWNWTQSDGTIISRANSSAVLNNAKLTAPENSAYLLVSVDTAYDYFLIKGAPVNERIDTTKKLVMFRSIEQFGKYSVESGKIDLLSALRPIPEKEMSSAVFYTTTLFNYETAATDLAISTLFEPLRVRDENGNQIAAIHCALDPAKYKTAILAYGYKADGTNDKPYRATDVTNGVLTLDSTTYYLVLHQYSNLDLVIGTEAPSVISEYHVGAGQEYTSFHDCLVALKDNAYQKTIHVYGGTYDILDEMGGAEFLTGLSSTDNWYDVCDIIPPNTHIIGHGNVIFDLTIPSWTSADIAVLLSPINMMGSATIENVTINCDGGRYCIHAEGERMTAYDNAVWRVLNCKINKNGNLSGVANAIGVGINNGGMLEIRDCVIANDGNAGLLVHDQQNVAGSLPVSPRILVAGCAFDVLYYPIIMSSTHSGAVSGAVLEMTVVNCYCNNKFMRKIGSGNVDVFHATYINTPHRTQNQDGILDVIPDTEYNNFALT